MRRKRRTKKVRVGRGLRRAESAAAAMQYPLTTKKSGTPIHNRAASTISQSAGEPPSAAMDVMKSGVATVAATEWNAITVKHASPRHASSVR